MRIPPPPSKPKMNDISKRYWTAVMIAQAITSGHQASSDNRIMSANEITKLSFEFADAILEQEDKT